VVW
jgi:hypothetical protein